MLNETDRMLIANFLRAYADSRAGAICNDFDLRAEGVPEEEWERIDRECEEANRSPEEHVPGRPRAMYRRRQPDYMVAIMLAKKLEASCRK